MTELTTEAVSAFMAAAGLPLSEAELAAATRAARAQQPLLAALYSAPGARYADPALVFVADPGRTTDWATY